MASWSRLKPDKVDLFEAVAPNFSKQVPLTHQSVEILTELGRRRCFRGELS